MRSFLRSYVFEVRATTLILDLRMYDHLGILFQFNECTSQFWEVKILWKILQSRMSTSQTVWDFKNRTTHFRDHRFSFAASFQKQNFSFLRSHVVASAGFEPRLPSLESGVLSTIPRWILLREPPRTGLFNATTPQVYNIGSRFWNITTQMNFSNMTAWRLENKTKLISAAKTLWVFESEFFELLFFVTSHFDVLRIERQLLNLD